MSYSKNEFRDALKDNDSIGLLDLFSAHTLSKKYKK